MTGAARVLQSLAFGAMTLFGVLGTLFLGGYAVVAPGGWAGAMLTAAWVLPMVVLCTWGLLRPASAAPVFVGVTAALLLFTFANAVLRWVPRDSWGPVTAISVFALAVSLGFLGLHRARLAGALLVTAAFGQVGAVLAGFAVHGALGPGGGPGPRAMLATSSVVVLLPMLLVGALFLLASALAHEPLRPVTRRHAAS
jgi:hypothetical protein